MEAIFVDGPLKGRRIVSELRPNLVVQRENVIDLIGCVVVPDGQKSTYGSYRHVSDGVYRWDGWDDEREANL